MPGTLQRKTTNAVKEGTFEKEAKARNARGAPVTIKKVLSVGENHKVG